MSGTPSRVFVARLADLPVLGPDGDQVGRVRDAVLTVPFGRQPPRMLGLVVEVAPRRRVFTPMGRVTAVDASAVIVTGTVNLRRFDTRPGETLVLGELLDRKVTLVEDASTVTLADVGVEQARSRDWVVTKVAVRRGGGGLRRRGQLSTVDWDAVEGVWAAQEQQGAASLLAAFGQLRPVDLAGVLQELTPQRRAEVAAALDVERLAHVLEEMPEDEQVQILAQLPEERVGDVLETMAPDDAADLLGELPDAERERLLELMEPQEAAPVRRLLTYSENTAGGLMTTEPVVLPPDATVAEALALIRDPDITPALASQVYVCRRPTETPTGTYLGIAHMQRLLREVPSSLVAAVADTDIAPLRPDCPLPEVTRYLATYNLVAVPVVDEDDHLLGAVTVDDVLDHLLPANWREHPHPRWEARGA